MVLTWSVEKRADSDFGYVVVFSDGIVVPWPLSSIHEDNLPILMHLYYTRRNWLILAGLEAEDTAEFDETAGLAVTQEFVRSVMKRRLTLADRLLEPLSKHPNITKSMSTLQEYRTREE